MKLKSKIILLGVTLAIVAGWLVLQLFNGLVTLNVRNMEVREVVKKIEWQTWQTILVHSNVQGKVTFNVRRMPLEEVLKIISIQTSSSWSAIYPLYSKKRSLALLERGLRGEIEPTLHGWTNLQNRFFPGGPGMMFGGPGMLGGPGGQAEPPPQRISLQIQNKDLPFTTLAFNRFAQLRIVPEDGTGGLINLILKEAKPSKAVAKLASQVHRSWTKLYTLRGGFGGPGGPRGPGAGNFVAGPRPGSPEQAGAQLRMERDTNAPPRMAPPAFAAMTPEQLEEMRKQREALEAELLKTLPDAERQRLEKAQQERMKEMQEMQNMTPEERRARFAQRGGPGGAFDRMNQERIKYSTTQQRVEMTRREREMRARMQNQGGGPPGQPAAPNR